ncbi:hypothetical protein AB4Z38_09295 [Arthrobacter sp. 2RAF6]
MPLGADDRHAVVLDMENSREDNGVLVWPSKAPLCIEPLAIRGS